ncbi:abortive infection system antitoxin AbiGi family protein [Puia sp.]|uniref:abortive infection system antitoxin AbiGi family protein n=1 Tax=Puia sp. TaxID=2045100 RepID=UPI0039C93449
MAISSETLFHFTPTLANLKGIVSDKFRIAYCFEQYTLDYQTHSAYYPMISFCDIPLSLAKNHINKYGSFAVGLTKDWGIRNKLNPVIYLETKSYLSHEIQSNLDHLAKMTEHLRNEFSKISSKISELAGEVVISKELSSGLVNVNNELNKRISNHAEVLT